MVSKVQNSCQKITEMLTNKRSLFAFDFLARGRKRMKPLLSFNESNLQSIPSSVSTKFIWLICVISEKIQIKGTLINVE